MAERHGRDDVFPKWPRWQYGKGCLSDQLIGQWLAEMLGLGYLYDRRHVRKALQSVFRHNWKSDLTDHACGLRIYAANDEAGLLIATWPRGEEPGYPFYFSSEVWCGIEYQVASHLIAEGFVEEGLAIVKGLRERYRGDRRNPWDEFECGHHYARSLASYALVGALSGFRYHGLRARLRFDPQLPEKKFQSFFSVATGWGVLKLEGRGKRAAMTVRVESGELTIRELECPSLTVTKGLKPLARVTVSVGRRRVSAAVAGRAGARRVVLEEPVTIGAGESMSVTFAQ